MSVEAEILKALRSEPANDPVFAKVLDLVNTALECAAQIADAEEERMRQAVEAHLGMALGMQNALARVAASIRLLKFEVRS